ncbi:MAG: hypothetical protein V4736_08290 [Bdellovibrionota bacterium]
MRNIFAWVFVAFIFSGVSSNTRSWQDISSDRILIPSEGSDYLLPNSNYPKLMMWLFNGPLRWSPEEIGELKTICPQSVAEIRDTPLKKISDEMLETIFARCSKPDSWSSYAGFIKLLSVDFQHLNHPFFKPVVLSFPEGQKIKGLLGIRSFKHPRPLVVVRIGVFGNALEFLGEKYLPMQLFEQGPFNVLVVESTSGSDYLKLNKDRWGLAGVDEGLQNFHIAQRLSDPSEPLSKLVSSIHFLGMSLGGQGLFTTSELLRHYSVPKIKNFVALCPVVHLQTSLMGLVEPMFQGFGADVWLQKRLEPFVESRFGKQYKGRSISGIFKLEPEFTHELIRLLGDNFDPPKFSEWGVGSWALSAKQSMDIMAEKLRLTPLVPFSVISAKDDPIVGYKKNTERLKYLEEKMDNFRIYTLPKGHHCAYPVTYDWSAVGEFIKKVVMGPVQLAKRYHESVLTAEGFSKAVTGEAQTLEVSAVRFEEETRQWAVTITAVPSGAEMVIQMTRADVDFDFPGEDLSPEEKVIGTRWLWQNLEILRDDASGLWKVRWPVYNDPIQ